MNSKRICPKCFFERIYEVRREKWRCVKCKYEWTPDRLPLYLNRSEWMKILKWFLNGLSTQSISNETGIHRQRILRALNVVRKAMSKDLPGVFSGMIEVEETYIREHGKNKWKKYKKVKAEHGGEMFEIPVLGILCRGGKVWAQVVPDTKTKTLLPLIYKQVKKGSVIYSDTRKNFSGISARDYKLLLVEDSKGEYADNRGYHLKGLEDFWGYLKSRLVSRGGIRKERLPLYLSEYVWRFNHRDFTIKQQTDNLLNLLITS